MDGQNVNVALVKSLFEADVHLGHKKNRLHPKARKYVYRIDNGVSIIDLTHTATQLEEIKKLLKKASAENKTLLVVATKKIASGIITEICEANNIPHVTTKWLPGLLTNFETLIKNVKKLNDMKVKRDEGEWEKITKHEKTKLQKHLYRLEKLYGGLAQLQKRPDLLFVIDARKEKNAVTEANASHIPVVAISDTNSDPGEVTYPLVANDDSPKSIEFLIKEIIGSYLKK